MGDAPDALDRRRLDHHEASARHRHHAEVLRCQSFIDAVVRRVLAHRRHDDAVREPHRAEIEGRETEERSCGFRRWFGAINVCRAEKWRLGARLSSPAVDMRLARPPHGALAIGALSAEPARHRTFRLKPMTIRHDVIDAIGNTPLIKLRRASEATGCTILGKAEFMNPGQSVKDRPRGR